MSLLLTAVLAASTVKAVGVVIAAITGHRLRHLRHHQHPRRASRDLLRDRAGRQPQAVLRRRDARGPAPHPRARHRPRAHGDHRHRPARSTGSTSRAGRRGAIENFDQTFINRGAQALRPHRRRWVQLRRLPRRRGRRRPGAAFTLTDADGEFVATVTWRAPALNTVLLRFSEEELRQILDLRPARHADARVGRRRRRPAHHPADRRAHRLPRLDPAHLRRGQGAGRGRAAPGARASARTPTIDYDDPAVGEALFNLGHRVGRRRAAPTPALGATPRVRRSCTAPSSPPTPTSSDYAGYPDGIGRLRLRAHQRGGPAPVPHDRRPHRASSTTGTEYGMLYGQRGQGSGRMPGFGDNPDDPTTRRRRRRRRDVHRGHDLTPSPSTRRSLGARTGDHRRTGAPSRPPPPRPPTEEP